MIELHRLELTDPLANAGAGHRVRSLAERLAFSTADATRLGVATREIAGRLDFGAEMTIGIECSPPPSRLVLAFDGPGVGSRLEEIAGRFFDEVAAEAERLHSARFLPDPAFAPDEAWVRHARLWMTELTASELRVELERKNEELRHLLLKLQQHTDAERRKNDELQEANRELERLREREYRLARYDSVTGLPTRTLFHDRLQQSIALARRHDNRVAILFVDLDHFKSLNDTFGHAAGDLALREVGNRMIGRVRGSDTVARLGGDEFAVILQELRDGKNAGIVAEKLIAALGEPIRLEDGEHRLGASVGIAIFPDHGDEPEELLERADEAMYRIKRKGRNDYAFAGSLPNESD